MHFILFNLCQQWLLYVSVTAYRPAHHHGVNACLHQYQTVMDSDQLQSCLSAGTEADKHKSTLIFLQPASSLHLPSIYIHIHCVPGKKTCIILNILYSCKSVAMKFSTICDMLMTLTTKCVHNLPPPLSYVSTLPDITQNRNTALTSWSRGPLTLWTVLLRASSTKPMANTAACICKGCQTYCVS